MKLQYLLLAAALITLQACEKRQTPAEEVKEKVNDALDNRPNEEIKDAAEETKDTLKDAAEDTKETLKDAAKDIKDSVKDATE